jgi:hypothetical protein
MMGCFRLMKGLGIRCGFRVFFIIHFFIEGGHFSRRRLVVQMLRKVLSRIIIQTQFLKNE